MDGDAELPISSGVFAKHPQTSKIGVGNIISNNLKWTQNLWFWSFCGVRKPLILEFLRNIRETSEIGVVNIINNI